MQLHTPDGARKYLTAGERDAFLRAAEQADRSVRTLCMTLAYSGCRLSEALALTADRVDLAGVWNQRIDSLSKGFKRRVGIAQALVHDPDVLILDEPTDGLDPNQKYEMRALIRDIAPHKAIIISTHILEEVEAVCSRAIMRISCIPTR